MYKVMIVDDEMLARVGIKSMIEWNQHGYEVVAEADNGQKALHLAEQLRPDIIITDIKMPVMNGVELIKQLEHRQYDMKYIVLSAYDDFAYVKEAMKAGAEDYLIKLELQPEQLLTKLHQIRAALEQEKVNKNTHVQALHPSRQQMILQDALMREILEGRSYTEQEVKNRLSADAWGIVEQAYICYVIQPDSFEIYDKYMDDDVHLLDYAMRNVLEEVISARMKAIVLRTSEREISIFLPVEQSTYSQSSEEELASLERAMKSAIKTYLNTTVVIGVSNVHRTYAGLRPGYKEAALAVDRRFSYRPGSTIQYKEACHIKAHPIDLTQELKQFEQMLAIGDETAITSLLSSMQQKLDQITPLSRGSVRDLCSTLLYVVDAALLSQSVEFSSAWKEHLAAKVYRLGNLADFHRWIDEFRQELMVKLFDSSDTSRLIRSIKQYIAQHYAENINLETISNQINLSSNYISHVFKRETGQTIVEYLTEWRIAQAKQMLQATDKKIYEIGQLVGYENEHYFSRVFKKVTGVSPNRYK